MSVQNVDTNFKMTEFTWDWKLTDLKSVKKTNLKSIVLFSAGGGSSLGHKMSGINILAANEIDPKMAAAYKKNLKPDYPVYLEDIRDFKKRDFPKPFYDLDILEGSPPCSSFSMTGNREKDWGKKKKFTEGQKEQVLDTLFFDYLDVVEKLRPKVFIAENVKGIISGKAINYAKKIVKIATELGYSVQVFKLNAKFMGVPQNRNRVFFIGNRMGFPKLELNFNEKLVLLKDIIGGINPYGKKTSDHFLETWKRNPAGYDFQKISGPSKNFNSAKLKFNKTPCVLTAGGQEKTYMPDKPFSLSDDLVKRISTFPLDYDAPKIGYICGMSVPPLMTHKICEAIKEQWFSI